MSHIASQNRQGSWDRPPALFAITIELNESALPGARRATDAYTEIRQTLAEHGFARQQCSVYFGDDRVDPVRCVLAVQALARKHVWFHTSVRDIRMSRIEDNNDLMPALLGA